MTALFSPPDVEGQHAAWGANCGPCALAALLGRPVAGVRALFPAFPAKPWCNPTHMNAALDAAGVRYSRGEAASKALPARGLAFLQFEGPWLADGVPVAAAYRHTHWVAAVGDRVYDVNAGLWLPRAEWEADVIPHLLAHTPRATGWHTRAVIDLAKPDTWKPNPCGCGGCSVCGFYGLAPKPDVPPPPPKAARPAAKPAAAKATAPTLFDEVPA